MINILIITVPIIIATIFLNYNSIKSQFNNWINPQDSEVESEVESEVDSKNLKLKNQLLKKYQLKKIK